MQPRKSKMALGKGKGGSKDMGITTSWENWCVNFSFFFITGTQTILWPWCPVILKAAGLRAFASGIALLLITISSIFGVRISLWALNKTRNGAVRRLFLLGMFFCSLFFSISSVLILPSTNDGYFCFTDSIASKIALKNEHVTKLTPSSTKASELDTRNIIWTNTETILTKDFTSEPSVSYVNGADLSKKSFRKATSGATSVPSTPIKKTTNQIVFIRKINLTQHNPNIIGPIMKTMFANNEDIHKQITRQMPSSSLINAVPPNKIGQKSSRDRGSDFYSKEFFNATNIKVTDTIKAHFSSLPYKSIPIHLSDEKRNKSTISYDLSATADVPQNSRYSNMQTMNFPSHALLTTKIMPPPSSSIFGITNPKPSQKEHNGKYMLFNYGDLDKGSIDNTPITSNSGDSLWEDYYSPNDKENFNMESMLHPRMGEESRILKRELKRKYLPTFDYQQMDGVIKNNDFNTNDNETAPSSNLGVGVAAILIIAMVMGGGVESVISKIWFCRKNGLYQDTERIDDMEITISPIFQICSMGEHRYWTLISSSLWITLPTIFIGLLCQMGANLHNPLTIMGVFHGLAGIMSCFTLLFIPMPYGSLRRCRTRRPISLYLDDEVIREGLRRVLFHSWVLVNGLLGALPTFFTLWLLQESPATKGEIFVSQVISITALLFGEAVIYPARNWLRRKLNTQGVMIMSSSFLWVQCLLSYYLQSSWLRSGSLLLVGYSVTTMWTAIRNNAFLLGTTRDQEQEAWASWICWKVGAALGAIIWASFLEMEQTESVQSLLLPSAIIGIIITTTLIFITLLTKTKNQSRRRIYHTLDLTNFSDEDDDEIASPEDENEDDWLVKRAKKEGLNL